MPGPRRRILPSGRKRSNWWQDRAQSNNLAQRCVTSGAADSRVHYFEQASLGAGAEGKPQFRKSHRAEFVPVRLSAQLR